MLKRYVIVPKTSGMSLATKQTLQDIVNFSSELGFTPIHLPQRISVASSLLYYSKILKSLLADVLLIPYPAACNPVKTTRLRILDSKVLEAISKNIGSLIVYVYDLPLEQIAYTKAHGWPS
ncbi:MAG TPA: hypothetical protein HA302_06550 [Thermococcaceae archaeon]|nr:hypothetical protein [Methanomassiliicoccales archaeon]HII67648.1 hypothetical protein [Thermococcaceae archaeon]